MGDLFDATRIRVEKLTAQFRASRPKMLPAADDYALATALAGLLGLAELVECRLEAIERALGASGHPVPGGNSHASELGELGAQLRDLSKRLEHLGSTKKEKKNSK